jgi:hypothetical protein
MQAASSLLGLHEVRSRYPAVSSVLTILNGGSAILVEGGLSRSSFRGASETRTFSTFSYCISPPSALYRDRLSGGAKSGFGGWFGRIA